MSVYKKSIMFTAILTFVSLGIAIILYYKYDENFWCNVCLGIFGSSILTLVTAIIGYLSERRSCLEAFYTETMKIINRLNRYQDDLTLDDKIDFFLNMADYDASIWDMLFGKMDFLDNKQRDYIYQNIYAPIGKVDKAISNHAWQLRMHKNKTVRNESAMESFVEEIEKEILEKTTHTITNEDNEEFSTTSIRNKIVNEILEELNGRYFEIMYGKKKESKMEV